MRIAFVALWLSTPLATLAADSALTREQVLSRFVKYEALNTDLLSSVSSGVGHSGKTYAHLRREAEAYGEGPFERALPEAVRYICHDGDRQILGALLRVINATSNSADEAPSESLGEIAACQLYLFVASLRPLPEATRADLVERALVNIPPGTEAGRSRVITRELKKLIQ